MTGTSSYIHLTEGRVPIADGHSRVYFCELNRYHSENVFRSFSVKYTFEGEVVYRTEREVYRLLPGHFLLSSQQPCECIVDSRRVTRNISIDINTSIMEEVACALLNQKPMDLDSMANGNFSTTDFFENIYPIHASPLGHYLKSLGQTLTEPGKPEKHVSGETFYTLAEHILFHQYGINGAIQQLDAVKSSTRKEIVRRLLNGRYFMDIHFLEHINIAEVARHANLSAYYFLRSFKKAFGISPYQYLIHKRLTHARELLLQHEAIQDVADRCGFPDSFSFSKAFKRKFGQAPSAFRPR